MAVGHGEGVVHGRGRIAKNACFTLVMAIAGLAPSIAIAHDFWIQPQRFWLLPGQSTSLAILVGHGPARQHWVLRLNRVVGLISVGPDGRRSDHSGALRQGTYAPDAELKFAKPGTHVVAFENTASLNSLPAERFNEYIMAEGLVPAIEFRRRTGATDQPGREIYSRRAKALVQVGRPAGQGPDQVTRPIGLALELVPEINPYRSGGANAFPVRVYYRGRPLAGAFVKLTNLDADEKPVETHTTNGSGRAIFQRPRSGAWQFNVVWTRPLSRNPDADFETIFSSLTFGFPSSNA